MHDSALPALQPLRCSAIVLGLVELAAEEKVYKSGAYLLLE